MQRKKCRKYLTPNILFANHVIFRTFSAKVQLIFYSVSCERKLVGGLVHKPGHLKCGSSNRDFGTIFIVKLPYAPSGPADHEAVFSCQMTGGAHGQASDRTQ